jgi:1,4-dihydroxy-2-naphthoyl-CoA hydrolase
MFETQVDVRLYDTDAAGIVFFANYFRIAHDAYQVFMKSIGHGLDRIIGQSDYLLPIVHAEADYKKPLVFGNIVTVSIKGQVKDTSFVVSYTLKDESGVTVAQLQTVHVAMDKRTGKKIALPEEIKKGLSTIS